MFKFPPLSERVPALLHGADYNPDQWLDDPQVFERDLEMMKQTRCNVMSVGIFSWSSLEPQEGRYEFGWLDTVLDRLHENGVSVFLHQVVLARLGFPSVIPRCCGSARNV